ncbi:response regulator (plasmid) [Lichenicola cladoniae]|uniref:Response regulator n=1 Tax=Lichenicola cladoniae TaxID=1484109 RepID=A0A6M8HYZ3_9PROT|nr:response regulator [Acetobacteraceae bacterium]QKE93759.1 response regulator [Lichenicola cladoniae]
MCSKFLLIQNAEKLASDGAEALALIEHPDQIRLVVTDINIPDFNGFDVAERARERHPGLPIVFVTALPDQVCARVNKKPFHCLRSRSHSKDWLRRLTKCWLGDDHRALDTRAPQGLVRASRWRFW